MGGGKGRSMYTIAVSLRSRLQISKRRLGGNISSKVDFINNGGYSKTDISIVCLFVGLGNDGPEQLSRNYGILLGIYGSIEMVYYMERSALC
jgi:hypothetical protein